MYINVTRERLQVSLSVNLGNDYKGRLECKTKCCWYVYCWVFCDNHTAATEGKGRYSYEKEPVLLDKHFTSQLLAAYNS